MSIRVARTGSGVDAVAGAASFVAGLGFRGPPCFLAGAEGSCGCERVYFVVMRVWGVLVGYVVRGWVDVSAEGRVRDTVVGLAWRRRVDCVSQDWAVGR